MAAIELTNTARDLAEILLKPGKENTTIQLDSVLKSEVKRVASKYPNASIEITDSIPQIAVAADDLLNSVVRNLLTNAVEHNDTDEPQVTVEVESQPAWVIVRITDNGPGIPESRREKIFDQGEMGLESEGTGMGLYLVKTLVDRYGGSVDVTDADPKGSTFTVRLPRFDPEGEENLGS